MTNRPENHGNDVPSRALVPFLILTFGITWGAIAPYIFAPEAATALFGEMSGAHPLFFLATWGPAIAAFGLVLFHAGFAGLSAFLSRLGLWRLPREWIAFILIGIPAVFMIGSVMKGGPLLAPSDDIASLLAIMVMMLFLGPVEEFGWRGIVQPILQRHVAPVVAGALVGAIWGIWHIPAFYLAGTVFVEWTFLPFFIGNVVLGVLVTPIFNASRGSLLWPILFHWQLINPFWPDAQPYDTWLLALVALLLYLAVPRAFDRASAVTTVIPAAGTAQGPVPQGAG